MWRCVRGERRLADQFTRTRRDDRTSQQAPTLVMHAHEVIRVVVDDRGIDLSQLNGDPKSVSHRVPPEAG